MTCAVPVRQPRAQADPHARVGLDVAHVGRLAAHLGDDPERVVPRSRPLDTGVRRGSPLLRPVVSSSATPGREPARGERADRRVEQLDLQPVTSLRLRSIAGESRSPHGCDCADSASRRSRHHCAVAPSTRLGCRTLHERLARARSTRHTSRSRARLDSPQTVRIAARPPVGPGGDALRVVWEPAARTRRPAACGSWRRAPGHAPPASPRRSARSCATLRRPVTNRTDGRRARRAVCRARAMPQAGVEPAAYRLGGGRSVH